MNTSATQILSYSNLLKAAAIGCLVLFTSACTHYSLAEEDSTQLSLAPSEGNELLNRYAPLLIVHDTQESFNKVGEVKAKSDGSVYIDPDQAMFYTHEASFEVEGRKYTNLVYRVHFSNIPFSIIPFHISWGKNVGLMFVVTVNENQEPVLFTTVHTCGCYKALIGTNHTPEELFPEKWITKDLLDKDQAVYGEDLPRRINFNNGAQDICVSIRPQEHRVMEVTACNKQNVATLDLSPSKPLSSLRAIPSEEGPVSFFHEKGSKEGFVKGAEKPWETLMLSWASLDLWVGTDKAYLRNPESDNTFYTSLKPWNRKKSDMADFPAFVNHWGWRL